MDTSETADGNPASVRAMLTEDIWLIVWGVIGFLLLAVLSALADGGC